MTKSYAPRDQRGLLSLSSLVSLVCKSTCLGLLIAQATQALPAPTIRPVQEAVERDLAAKVIHGGDDAVWDFFARSGFFPEAVAARAMQKEHRGFEGYQSLWANVGTRVQGPHDYKPVEPVEPGNPRGVEEDDESKQHYEHSRPNPGHNGRDMPLAIRDQGAHDHESAEPIIGDARDIEADGMRQHYEPPHADPGHGERDLHAFARDQGPHDHKSPEPIDGPEGRSFERDQGPHYYKPIEPGNPPAVESADGSHNSERRFIARDQGPHDHPAPHAKPGPGNGDPPAVEVDGARSSHSSPEIQPPSGPWIGRSTGVLETDGNRHYPTDPKKQPGSAPWFGGRALASPEDVIVIEREPSNEPLTEPWLSGRSWVVDGLPPAHHSPEEKPVPDDRALALLEEDGMRSEHGSPHGMLPPFHKPGGHGKRSPLEKQPGDEPWIGGSQPGGHGKRGPVKEPTPGDVSDQPRVGGRAPFVAHYM